MDTLRFDSDSFYIGEVNHTFRCISNNINHFITSITHQYNTILRGSGRTLKVHGEGTILWTIIDNHGHKYDIIIKHILHVPNISQCLLSSQHWTKQAKDNSPTPQGVQCATYDDTCVLQWQQRKYTRTISLDKSTSTPTLYSASASTTFKKASKTIEYFTEASNHEQTVAVSSTTDTVLEPTTDTSNTKKNNFMSEDNNIQH